MMCLDCNKKLPTGRGCCGLCRRKQRIAIVLGITTEQALMAAGKLKADVPNGKKMNAWLKRSLKAGRVPR